MICNSLNSFYVNPIEIPIQIGCGQIQFAFLYSWTGREPILQLWLLYFSFLAYPHILCMSDYNGQYLIFCCSTSPILRSTIFLFVMLQLFSDWKRICWGRKNSHFSIFFFFFFCIRWQYHLFPTLKKSLIVCILYGTTYLLNSDAQ